MRNPLQDSVTVLHNDGAQTRGPWGGKAARRGQPWWDEAAKERFTEVIPGEILRWDWKITLRVKRGVALKRQP